MGPEEDTAVCSLAGNALNVAAVIENFIADLLLKVVVVSVLTEQEIRVDGEDANGTKHRAVADNVKTTMFNLGPAKDESVVTEDVVDCVSEEDVTVIMAVVSHLVP